MKCVLLNLHWMRVGHLNSPMVLIGDKAYDTDPLDAALRCRGIEMVSPHKKIVRNRLHRMVVVYAEISVVSKWSVFSVG